MKIYLLNKKNNIKVWDIISSKLISNKRHKDHDFSKYQSTLNLQVLKLYFIDLYKLGSNMYVLKKMLVYNMGEYLVVETKVNNNELELEIKKKIIYLHSRCSEVRGT